MCGTHTEYQVILTLDVIFKIGQIHIFNSTAELDLVCTSCVVFLGLKDQRSQVHKVWKAVLVLRSAISHDCISTSMSQSRTYPELPVGLATKQELVIEEEFVGIAIIQVTELHDSVVRWSVRKKAVSHWQLYRTIRHINDHCKNIIQYIEAVILPKKSLCRN